MREIIEMSKYLETGVNEMKKRNLRQRRKKLGYTLNEMGAKIGLSGATIRNMEFGNYSYYEESYDELLTEEEVKRLHELIQIYPAEATRHIGELLSGRSDEEDPPVSGLRAV